MTHWLRYISEPEKEKYVNSLNRDSLEPGTKYRIVYSINNGPKRVVEITAASPLQALRMFKGLNEPRFKHSLIKEIVEENVNTRMLTSHK